VHDLCIAATGQLRSGVEPGVMQTTRNKNNFIYHTDERRTGTYDSESHGHIHLCLRKCIKDALTVSSAKLPRILFAFEMGHDVRNQVCLDLLTRKRSSPIQTGVVFQGDAREISVSQMYFVILIPSESAKSVFLTQPL